MKETQFVIVMLLVANLLATIWFGIKDGSEPVVTQMTNSTESQLPKIINSSVKSDIYEKFSSAFNVRDYDALYNMFGPTAQLQFSRESAQAEFEKLAKFFHSVERGSFSYSEHAGKQGNLDLYVLYYIVQLSEKSEFGTKGTLKVSVAVEGADYQIYGIFLNAGGE